MSKTSQLDIKRTVKSYWLANNPVMYLVTEEPYRIIEDVGRAAAELKEERDIEVDVFCHDKVSGFHQGKPHVKVNIDGTSVLATALALAVMSPKEIAEQQAAIAAKMSKMPGAGEPPPLAFDPAHNIIFVMKNVGYDLTERSQAQPLNVQILRNIIQGNMTSDTLYDGERGRRLFILISPTEKIPEDLPELDRIIVPLPDEEMIEKAVVNVVDPLVGVTSSGVKTKMKKVEGEKRQELIASLKGMPYQKIEDTLGLAAAENKGYANWEAFIGTILHRKGQVLGGVQGLEYIHREDIPFDTIPGMEKAVKFLNDRVHLSPEVCAKRNLMPLRGITLVGLPGVGKTIFGMLVAKIMGRDLVILNLGETQGGLVGDSERNIRRAIEAIKAVEAVALVDDIDKAGVGATRSGQSGDSGTFGRTIQTMLTEMSSHLNRCIWVFTANRLQNIPPELIRAGRMDERFFVQSPDWPIRLDIMNLHATRHNSEFDDTSRLEDIAKLATEGWVGAELADLVKNAVIKSIADDTTVLDTNWMATEAARITPMSQQRVYQADLEFLEVAADQFTKIGRANGDDTKPKKAPKKTKGAKI